MRREGVLSGGHSHLAYRCSYFASVALALLFAGSLVPYRMTVGGIVQRRLRDTCPDRMARNRCNQPIGTLF